jgi:hypothetical protein
MPHAKSIVRGVQLALELQHLARKTDEIPDRDVCEFVARDPFALQGGCTMAVPLERLYEMTENANHAVERTR